jgi:S-adenosylmethionine:diacylglycerol 3-amino-3-carboxypropyl transferase
MGIVFTRAWEDDRLDAELLAVRHGERVLVVAGAGDTALALAAAGGEVLAVDRNPDQLRLGALKLAAAAVLPASRLHAWFEAGRDPALVGEYHARVRARLAGPDAVYWDGNLGLFERGLHRSTGLARRFIQLGRIARLVRPDLPGRVESFSDPREQRDWWRRSVRPWLFGPVSHWLAAHSPLLNALSPDRNETLRVRRAGWSRGLARRIDDVLGRLLVREHPWWRPLASGRPASVGSGAAWLDATRVERLAAGNDRLRWVEADLITALAAEAAHSLDAISVSNVPDWLDDGAEISLARSVARAAAPRARILVRHLVRPDGRDPFVDAGLERDPASAELVGRDRTALYEAVDLYRAP